MSRLFSPDISKYTSESCIQGLAKVITDMEIAIQHDESEIKEIEKQIKKNENEIKKNENEIIRNEIEITKNQDEIIKNENEIRKNEEAVTVRKMIDFFKPGFEKLIPTEKLPIIKKIISCLSARYNQKFECHDKVIKEHTQAINEHKKAIKEYNMAIKNHHKKIEDHNKAIENFRKIIEGCHKKINILRKLISKDIPTDVEMAYLNKFFDFNDISASYYKAFAAKLFAENKGRQSTQRFYPPW